MVKIALTPDWFLGKDLIIDIFSFVVLALFTFFAYKYYKMSKNKGTANLGKGFGFIALAELADIATKLVLFYNVGPSRASGEALITINIISSLKFFIMPDFSFSGSSCFWDFTSYTGSQKTRKDLLRITY